MTIVSDYLKSLSTVGIGYETPGDVESAERNFVSQYLAQFQNPTVLDVGAHVGDYSALALSVNPNTQIYAFEPQPQAYEAVRQKLANKNVKVFNLAIGESERETEIFDCSGPNATPQASLFKDVIETLAHSKARAFPVKVRTIDNLVKELNISNVSLLKIDTEGNELNVMKGAHKTFEQGKIAAVQFEFNDMNVISRTFFKDFWDFLKDYKIYRLSKNGMIHIEHYVPVFCEVFALQNIVGIRKDLLQ